MISSQGESRIVSLLRELIVATVDILCNKLSTSRSTVLRELKNYGYFSSYNFNSSCSFGKRAWCKNLAE